MTTTNATTQVLQPQKHHLLPVLPPREPDEMTSVDHLHATGNTGNLAYYFGEEPARRFWERLSALGVRAADNGGVIELAPFENDLTAFAGGLVGALEVLLESELVARYPEKDSFPDREREAFLESAYGEAHAALFDLSRRFACVWVQGWDDYMVRTAHRIHPSSGVSLVTSEGRDRLLLGQIR